MVITPAKPQIAATYAVKQLKTDGRWVELKPDNSPCPVMPQMYALKHARMGGNPEAIADVKNEVDVMKAVRGHPNVLTLRAVVMQGPPGGEVRVSLQTHSLHMHWYL